MQNRVADGQQVNIPALDVVFLQCAHLRSISVCMDRRPARERLRFGKADLYQRDVKKSTVVYSYLKPYRKPTQVGRLRKPRRTSEAWLRNSAK